MGDAGGAIEAEVTRLVCLVTKRLMASGCGMRVRAGCPIERVAVLMLAECGVDAAPAHGIKMRLRDPAAGEGRL
jgi:hypothetical protein